MNIQIPLQQRAYEYVKQLIQGNDLDYHTIYSETKISKEIGVSRTPMRDALHRLAQERFIDILPSKGFCLHQITRQDMIETFQIRSAIEGYCTVYITRNFQTDEMQRAFADLFFLLEKQREIMGTTHDTCKFTEYDNQFHERIVSCCKNQTLQALFQSYLFQIRRLALLSLRHEGRMEATYSEHMAIYNCMKEGNLSDIYQTTLNHMEIPLEIHLSDAIK